MADDGLQASKVEKKISFIKEEELAPIPENSTLSKESTMFIEFASVGEGANGDTALPPHAAALVELFGRSAAEEFLHPRMEAGGGARSRSTADPGVRRERTGLSALSAAGTDVDSLWSSLRADSQARLLRRDARISDRLKRAYDAFARQCLARAEAPPERSFAPGDSLTTLSRLLAESQVDAVRARRRKKELMFRLAQVHQNQFRILEHNNPLPDLVNRSGDASVAIYVPSWADEDDEGPWEDPGTPAAAPPLPRRRPQPRPTLSDLAAAGGAPGALRRAPESPGGRRFLFLREREYEGDFSSRVRAREEPLAPLTARPPEEERRRAPAGRLLPGFALRRRSAHLGGLESLPGARGDAGRGRAGRSAPAVGEGERRALVWEPLSLGALLEYKSERRPPIASEKPFRAGAAAWWDVGEARV